MLAKTYCANIRKYMLLRSTVSATLLNEVSFPVRFSPLLNLLNFKIYNMY